MRAGLGLMTAFLGLASVVQVNDPDALIWMEISAISVTSIVCTVVAINVFITLVTFLEPEFTSWCNSHILQSVYGLPAILTLCAFLKTSLLESGWWWGCCAVVFSGDLLFTSIVMAGYLQQQALTWNIVSTEEGRESAGLMIVLLWLLILLFSSSSLRNESFWKRNIFLAYTIIPVASWIAYKYYIQKNITVPEHCEGVI